MGYRTALAGYIESKNIAPGLRSHLQAPELDDLKSGCVPPFIADNRGEPILKEHHPLDPKRVRLPARLASPLIPYPDVIKRFFTDHVSPPENLIHGHHAYHIDLLHKMRSRVVELIPASVGKVVFSVTSLMRICRCSFSTRTAIINSTALEFAKRATAHELSITAMEEIKYNPSVRVKSPYLSFLISMQRMRTLLALKGDMDYMKEMISPERCRDATAIIYEDGTYSYIKYDEDEIYILIAAGSHFAIFHSAVSEWFIGNITYLDYALTLSDTINNLEVLSFDATYSWAQTFFSTIIKLAENTPDHNTTVNFMKSLEGFILNLSDYDEEYAMNWVPIMDAAFDLWVYDKKLSNTDYDFVYIPALLHNKAAAFPRESYLCTIISTVMKMSRTQMQEVSSLHKFVFYAEVDAVAGVNKFLMRVHSRRQQDDDAVRNITRLAKQKFVIAYIKKHKGAPNFKNKGVKENMIELMSTSGKLMSLLSYPLKWWDDITPWNCMDNTLTDDALEFAKDKGALKGEIRFGPGDSKKELLQVIQKEDYKLKDLLADGGFTRQEKYIERRRQSDRPVHHMHPARLIEKEREQKVEARLFANAELSNKHALSVCATKMKKVLSYFDGQMMTPSDSQRKQKLHNAAQLLRSEKNYSMLLDIEGHNQSMQEANTSELLDFIGNIFGESNWGSLSNYFGALLVYHYDEYLDEVIVSKGQHGGIEGWLNPLWTMHTLLMMQLLDFMTDINMRQLMVYSDDVNAIIEIQQPTEAGIQALFSKVMSHCFKFGMIAKFSQTTLSKHRATMLRQHYSEGYRADSTLKRLMAVSGANNPMVVSEELEVAGICSSAASALEMSNHSNTCCYLKNYKLGILLARLPHMLLARPQEEGSLSSLALPVNLAQLLYNIKDESMIVNDSNIMQISNALMNDLQRYTGQHKTSMTNAVVTMGLESMFKLSLAQEKFSDSADRLLYLQLYDKFLQDLLFFLIYMPASVGGLGGILHINMMLSGHSNGFSKSMHYLHQWIFKYSSNANYFSEFMMNALSNSITGRGSDEQHSILTTQWPSERSITPASTSLSSAIKSMIKRKTKNKHVLSIIELSKDTDTLAKYLVSVFRMNYHPRIAQFYYENSSVHFFDLLINKIETSSGLLTQVSNLSKLRKSLVERTLKNIRIASNRREKSYGRISRETDIISYLMYRREVDFPTINFIKTEEVLYDDKIQPTEERQSICTVRRCVPTHYESGITVYNDPKIGNEVLYKGEYLDHNRMIGNKEELLAAKVCSITKWLLTKTLSSSMYTASLEAYDCVLACNATLQTLTGHTFKDLMLYCPDETGGEILHRIPNMRFSTVTYIRSEMNKSLGYTNELNQYSISERGLLDSNINFDYLRLRLTLAMMIKHDFDANASVITRYDFTNLQNIHDVQFVTPHTINNPGKYETVPYAVFRNHKFSDLRFRFIAASYLTAEDLTDLALLPNIDILSDLQKFGNSIIGEIVYKYARALDKEYMTMIPTYPRDDIWLPLYRKLEKVDPKIGGMLIEEKKDYVMHILSTELLNRSGIRFKTNTDKVHLLLQNEIISRIHEDHPNDALYSSITTRYLQLSKNMTNKEKLQLRISDYSNFLNTHRQYVSLLSKLLLAEIIVTIHFKVKTNLGAIIMDVKRSIESYEDVGFMMPVLSEINPELYIRCLILGNPTLKDSYSRNKSSLMSYLYEISNDIVNMDIDLPSLHISTKNITTLAETWELPDSASSIVYHIEPLSAESMKTFSDLLPMVSYIERTCHYSARPAVLASPTGSDSCQAQYGLFKELMHKFGIGPHMTICDLTAGRGDGKYAFNALGLKSQSFSRSDTFTNVLHHPNIIFNDQYDVFKTETLTFCTDYDFVHIDISFTGRDDPDISDCILYLESLSIPYSLRINSINLNIYQTAHLENAISYDHYIAHSVSSTWRPYQVYLIGIPGSTITDTSTLRMKKTAAFRSMALSYTSMLKFSFTDQYSLANEVNSVTICLPNQNSINDLLSYVADKCVIDERHYYLDRFLNEFMGDNTIYLSRNHVPPLVDNEVTRLRGTYTEITGTVYDSHTVDDMGQVSIAAARHHERHITTFHDPESRKIKIELNRESVILMNLLRRHHPLHDIRRLCNVLLGVARMCPEIDDYTLENIMNAREMLPDDHHIRLNRSQKDFTEALKLHIVSVGKNDELLPLRYCSLMGVEYPSKKKYYERIRKTVKMMSGLRPLIMDNILNGTIRMSSVEAIGDELFIRKCLNYEQAQKYRKSEAIPPDLQSDSSTLELNLDGIFKSFEQFSMSNLLSVSDPTGGDLDVDDPFSRMEDKYKAMYEENGPIIEYDLQIEDRIAAAVEDLGLVLDPVTGIYEGFDIDVPSDEDLY